MHHLNLWLFFISTGSESCNSSQVSVSPRNFVRAEVRISRNVNISDPPITLRCIRNRIRCSYDCGCRSPRKAKSDTLFEVLTRMDQSASPEHPLHAKVWSSVLVGFVAAQVYLEADIAVKPSPTKSGQPFSPHATGLSSYCCSTFNQNQHHNILSSLSKNWSFKPCPTCMQAT
jgi:hypothetical protein